MLACSAGVFFECANVLLAKGHVETRKEGRALPLPSFLLSPYHLPLGLLFLLSLIFLRHDKDGGYNSTNINTQRSPTQNTPALQASTMYLLVQGCARNWVEISSPQNLSVVKLDTTLIQSQAIFILYRIAFRGRMNSNGPEQHQSFTHVENRGGAVWPIGFMH